MQINFYNSIFVVQKVPQATRVARGEKEIRCESETVPAAVSSIPYGQKTSRQMLAYSNKGIYSIALFATDGWAVGKAR